MISNQQNKNKIISVFISLNIIILLVDIMFISFLLINNYINLNFFYSIYTSIEIMLKFCPRIMFCFISIFKNNLDYSMRF